MLAIAGLVCWLVYRIIQRKVHQWREADDALGDEGRKYLTAVVKVEVKSLAKYTRSDALILIRNCFPKLFTSDLFHSALPQSDENGEVKKTYNILDIHKACVHLEECQDMQKLSTAEEGAASNQPSTQTTTRIKCNTSLKKHLPVVTPDYNHQETHSEEAAFLRDISPEETAQAYWAFIQKEYEEATSEEATPESDHGTGFVISDHCVITNYHVIVDALSDKTKEHQLSIANKTIGKLLCEVIDYCPSSDLALLYCKDLNLEQGGINPLPLSVQASLEGQSIFILGYQFTYPGRRALFKRGSVAGYVDRYGRPPFLVLDCSVAPGLSGSPVVRWISGQLRVVAVLSQKHKKDVRTIDEMNTHEGIRSELENSRSDTRTQVDLLTLKMCDSLETHSQFGLCNAVPGDLVGTFIQTATFRGEKYKEELEKVVAQFAENLCL